MLGLHSNPSRFATVRRCKVPQDDDKNRHSRAERCRVHNREIWKPRVQSRSPFLSKRKGLRVQHRTERSMSDAFSFGKCTSTPKENECVGVRGTNHALGTFLFSFSRFSPKAILMGIMLSAIFICRQPWQYCGDCDEWLTKDKRNKKCLPL